MFTLNLSQSDVSELRWLMAFVRGPTATSWSGGGAPCSPARRRNASAEIQPQSSRADRGSARPGAVSVWFVVGITSRLVLDWRSSIENGARYRPLMVQEDHSRGWVQSLESRRGVIGVSLAVKSCDLPWLLYWIALAALLIPTYAIWRQAWKISPHRRAASRRRWDKRAAFKEPCSEGRAQKSVFGRPCSEGNARRAM